MHYEPHDRLSAATSFLLLGLITFGVVQEQFGTAVPVVGWLKTIPGGIAAIGERWSSARLAAAEERQFPAITARREMPGDPGSVDRPPDAAATTAAAVMERAPAPPPEQPAAAGTGTRVMSAMQQARTPGAPGGDSWALTSEEAAGRTAPASSRSRQPGAPALARRSPATAQVTSGHGTGTAQRVSPGPSTDRGPVTRFARGTDDEHRAVIASRIEGSGEGRSLKPVATAVADLAAEFAATTRPADIRSGKPAGTALRKVALAGHGVEVASLVETAQEPVLSDTTASLVNDGASGALSGSRLPVAGDAIRVAALPRPVNGTAPDSSSSTAATPDHARSAPPQEKPDGIAEFAIAAVRQAQQPSASDFREVPAARVAANGSPMTRRDSLGSGPGSGVGADDAAIAVTSDDPTIGDALAAAPVASDAPLPVPLPVPPPATAERTAVAALVPSVEEAAPEDAAPVSAPGVTTVPGLAVPRPRPPRDRADLIAPEWPQFASAGLAEDALVEAGDDFRRYLIGDIAIELQFGSAILWELERALYGGLSEGQTYYKRMFRDALVYSGAERPGTDDGVYVLALHDSGKVAVLKIRFELDGSGRAPAPVRELVDRVVCSATFGDAALPCAR